MDSELKAYLDDWRGEVNSRFARVDEKLDKINRRQDVFDRRFDLVAEALVRIEHRLERAEIN